MSLFAEMKVRRYSVFEEVNEEISNENKQRGFLARERDALRNHLQDRRRQHEPGSDGHEVFQVAAIPMPLNKNRAAEDVSCGGGQTQHKTENEDIHREVLSSRFSVLGKSEL